MLGDTLTEELDGGRGALGAVVAVHREVPADDRSDAGVPGVLAPALELLEVPGAGGGERVAAVGERVDDHLGGAQLGPQGDERLDVALRGVDTAVGDEADEVDAICSLEG